MDKNTATLLLKLLKEKDMYGYEMIDTLKKRSDHTFDLKAGTLYPLLHQLEQQDAVTSYEEKAPSERVRKYYHLTEAGKALLNEKEAELKKYVTAISKVLEGGFAYELA